MPTLAEQINQIRRQKGLTQPAAPTSPTLPTSNRPAGRGRGRGGNQSRARRRLAAIRLADPKALPGVKPTARGNFKRSDRYAILGAHRDLKKKQAAKRDKDAEDNYNPLSPLYGKDMKREVENAERLEFGDAERSLGESFKSQERQQALVGSAYDQYRQALTDATGRINQSNAAAAKGTQDAVDKAYAQDKTSNAAQSAARQKEMAQFGLSGAAVPEANQAVEAARSQGNQRAGEIRQQGAADTTFMEGRTATSVQAKAEALAREGRRREELEGRRGELAAQKGAFRNQHRAKLREGEREWAAIQKEFGLKEASLAQDAKSDKQSNAAQVLVAKLYSDASKAKARATIRVAKLQLEKGKIDQKQYREIVNIYKGLPEKGSVPEAKPKAKPSLQTWERDKIDQAINSLQKNNVSKSQKAKFIKKMVDGGLTPRLARIAWNRYERSLTTPYDDRTRG